MSAQAEPSSAVVRPTRRWVDPARKDGGTTGAGLDLLRVVGHLVLHDVTVPGHFGLVLDHVIAGPSGVYVVTMISHDGHLTITEDLLVCDRTPLTDAVADASDAASAVRTLLGAAPVLPLLCFDRTEDLAGVVGDVAVCSAENVLELLTGQPDVMTPDRQREITRILTDTLVRAVRQSETRPGNRSARRAPVQPAPTQPLTQVAAPISAPTPEPAPIAESEPKHRDQSTPQASGRTEEPARLPTRAPDRPEGVVQSRPAARHAARPTTQEVPPMSTMPISSAQVWTPAPAYRENSPMLAPQPAEVAVFESPRRIRVAHPIGLALMMTGVALFVQALFLLH